MRLFLSSIVLLSAVPLLASPCRFSEERKVEARVAPSQTVRIEAGAGILHVTGRPGLATVRATGKVCASKKSLLKEAKLTTKTVGNEVQILSEPRNDSWSMFSWDDHVRIDLTVEVPDNANLIIEDGSGDAEVAHVARLTLSDGSGDLTIDDVRGPLKLTDGSGDVRVSNVAGEVSARDGSGSMDFRGLKGGLIITQDGSGDIAARHVNGNVNIRQDGSGSIDVSDVSGNFSVESDGSGGIDHARVRGRVSIPSER